jgi:hypothetical protein
MPDRRLLLGGAAIVVLGGGFAAWRWLAAPPAPVANVENCRATFGEAQSGQVTSASDKVAIAQAARACKEALSSVQATVLDVALEGGPLQLPVTRAEFESIMREQDKTPIQLAYERRNRDLDPQLVWRGKDEQDWSDLIVSAPPLYIQEKVHPQVLIEDLKRQSQLRARSAARRTPSRSRARRRRRARSRAPARPPGRRGAT